VTPENPWVRLLALLLATAIVIHVAYALIRPALPFLAVLIVFFAFLRLWIWYRDRF
jgi:hypothetical protein